MKKSAKDFSREEIYLVAKAYSSGKYTYRNFMDEYDCSQKTFYTIINWAVVKGIVSDEEVKLIDIVAVDNSSAHMSGNTDQQKAVTDRGLRCNKLRHLERELYTFPKSEAISWIKKYLESDLSKYNFCKKYYMTIKVFQQSLVKAIVQGWVSLKVVEELRKKAKLNNDEKIVDEFFDYLLSKRELYKNSKKQT